jgi:hypothetical protein
MTSQGSAHGRFSRAIRNHDLLNAEIAARELGDLNLPDAFAFCLLLADVDRTNHAAACQGYGLSAVAAALAGGSSWAQISGFPGVLQVGVRALDGWVPQPTVAG